MSTAALLRRQFRMAHGLLDAAIEQAPRHAFVQPPPAGGPSPAVHCAEALLSEDLTVNGVLRATRPLALSSWAGRTGLSELPPLSTRIDWPSWERTVFVDVGQARSYARAVCAATDAYLAALPDAALEPGSDGTLVQLLNGLLFTLAARRGEITHLVPLARGPGSLLLCP